MSKRERSERGKDDERIDPGDGDGMPCAGVACALCARLAQLPDLVWRTKLTRRLNDWADEEDNREHLDDIYEDARKAGLGGVGTWKGWAGVEARRERSRRECYAACHA